MILSDDHGQSIDFNIPEHFQKIAVNCSGGADSSILLWMIASYLKDNDMSTEINVLTCANDYKHRWNVRRAADVINYVIDGLNWNQFNIHYSYYRDFQDTKYFHEIERNLLDEGKVETIISGINRNPRIPAVITDINGKIVDLTDEALPERDTDESDPWVIDNTFYMPFVNVDKRFIAAMYDHYQVQDLFDLTRSCEAIPPHNKYDRNFENSPCGECWWCLERKWAFGRF